MITLETEAMMRTLMLIFLFGVFFLLTFVIGALLLGPMWVPIQLALMILLAIGALLGAA